MSKTLLQLLTRKGVGPRLGDIASRHFRVELVAVFALHAAAQVLGSGIRGTLLP